MFTNRLPAGGGRRRERPRQRAPTGYARPVFEQPGRAGRERPADHQGDCGWPVPVAVADAVGSVRV